MIRFLLSFLLIIQIQAVCDGNPHGWDRQRRCDGNNLCPGDKECGICEGVGGIPFGDENEQIKLTKCTPVATPNQFKDPPTPPSFPDTFKNTGFYEVQIFVKHDPLCFVQVPDVISNGTHCFKPQQGTFYFSWEEKKAMMDYFEADTIFPGVNMSYHFYHESSRVHPDIYKYGVPVWPDICPCINVSTGIVKPDWAKDAKFVGREFFEVEYLWKNFTMDHFVKGPHHVWKDIETGNIVRLWQPWNGLEVFDPTKYEDSFDVKILETPRTCNILTNVCIDPYANNTNWEHDLCEKYLKPIGLPCGKDDLNNGTFTLKN